ncbi:MAG TPA: bestrophin family ion channel [Planctomycetia bacterium]|nr:bestrophin family ion channel [Planctomycetia bacterium]
MAAGSKLLFGWLPTLNVAQRLGRWLAVAMTYAVAVELIVYFFNLPKWTAGQEVAAGLWVVLGMLVVFRNNAANDRWWEARRLWGQLINDSRNLALKAKAHAAAPAAEHSELAELLVEFANALRLHLRGIARDPEDAPCPMLHPPGAVAARIHALLDRWNRSGALHHTIRALDDHARGLMDVCGACERIRSSPLPSSYRALLRSALALYVLFAPWSVALETRWWGVPILFVGLGFLFGIEVTAEEIEEPFGDGKDDLPLESFCTTIETFVQRALAPGLADDSR